MVTFAKTTLPTGDNVNIRKIFLALAATMALAIQGAQAQHLLKTSYEANGLYGSGSYAPFWHIANRQGLGSTENASAYTRLGIEGTNIFNSRTSHSNGEPMLLLPITSHQHSSCNKPTLISNGEE